MASGLPSIWPASVQTVVQSVLSWIEDAVNGLTVVDWVLLGLAVAIVWYLIARLKADSELGPVEVSELESDDDGADVKSLTAALRNHLADSGLLPSPEVPAGAPETSLLTAVKESPIPQANWVATLIDAVPKPRPASYKLKGTLRQDDELGRGVTYVLQDTAHGTSVEVRTAWKPSEKEAVRDVASRVYMAITRAAEHIYPRWTRWSNSKAFESYRTGLAVLIGSRGRVDREAEYDVALSYHRDAARDEPRNVLPRLQIANITEKQAAVATGSDNAALRLKAVQDYLQIANDVPSLAEARYRASVLLGSLATDVDALDGYPLEALRQSLPAELSWPGGDGVSNEEIARKLRSAADHESKAALRRLSRLSTVMRLRFPTMFEPRGHERKGIRTAIKIARRCERARHRIRPKTCGENRREWILQWWWNLRVIAALLDISGHASWQVHYNAACLYALMYAVTPDRARWRRNALRRLNTVVEDPHSELREDWLAARDPDLDSIRDGSPEWRNLVRRYCRDPVAVDVIRPDRARGRSDANGR